MNKTFTCTKKISSGKDLFTFVWPKRKSALLLCASAYYAHCKIGGAISAKDLPGIKHLTETVKGSSSLVPAHKVIKQFEHDPIGAL